MKPAAPVLAVMTLVAWQALAHDPDASPLARVSQRVGAGEISVEYSRPGVKQRKIWGDLVPHGKLWRTGANASTKITFSKPVLVGGKPVPAGTYSVLTIPAEKSWTLILNKNTAVRGSLENYKQQEDIVRVNVTTAKIPHRERLTFIFSDVTSDAVTLDLEWEQLRVSIPIKLG